VKSFILTIPLISALSFYFILVKIDISTKVCLISSGIFFTIFNA